MTTLIASPAARALGWALLHFLWQGAAIAVLLAVALYVWRGARTRYLLACGAMVAMVLAFAVTLAVCWPAADRPVARTLKLGTAAAVRLAPGSESGSPFVRDAGPPRWFVPAWLCGVSLFYCYSLARWIAARRLRTRGTFPAPVVWHERLQALAAGLRLPRAVALLESCLVDVPVVIGYLRPVILLPLGMLAGLEPAQVEAILLHELAHIRRYDYLVNLLQSLVEGLLFYHPAVWWTGAVMRREREHCCDDFVVALRGDAHGYAAALARLELGRGERQPALAATGGNLMRRIHRLMQQPEGPRVAAPLVSAVVLLATATLAVAAWHTEQAAAPLPDPAAVPQQTATPAPRPLTPRQQQRLKDRYRAWLNQDAAAIITDEITRVYQKWLTEDVAYIITDAERTAFKNLQTAAEREQFIEQFWLRRDPTPGTVENEFKEEHYRRIAYSNEHFAPPSGPAGWKTDRGRIYIQYGPPDEIENHPGTASTAPSQQWLYRFIAGVGNNIIIEFVDSERTGDYRMTMDPAENAALAATTDPLKITASVLPATPAHERTVSLFVPLGAVQHRLSVAGRVMTLAGRPVATFTDMVEGPQASFAKTLSLLPGTYRTSFIVKDEVTHAVRLGELTFQVQ